MLKFTGNTFELSGIATKEECCKNSNDSTLCFKSTSFTTCLSARSVIENAHFCASNACALGYICLTPFTEDINSTFHKITVLKTEQTKKVLFLGHPGEIYSSVEVSSYVTNYRFIILLPGILHSLLIYLSSISAGQACVNLVPCIEFDGCHLSKLVVFSLFFHKYNINSVKRIHNFVIFIGTILIAFTVVLSFINFLT